MIFADEFAVPYAFKKFTDSLKQGKVNSFKIHSDATLFTEGFKALSCSIIVL